MKCPHIWLNRPGILEDLGRFKPPRPLTSSGGARWEDLYWLRNAGALVARGRHPPRITYPPRQSDPRWPADLGHRAQAQARPVLRRPDRVLRP